MSNTEPKQTHKVFSQFTDLEFTEVAYHVGLVTYSRECDHTDPFSVEKKDLTEAMALLLDSLIVKFVLWKRLRAQKQNNGR